jgi:hypothetical protein
MSRNAVASFSPVSFGKHFARDVRIRVWDLSIPGPVERFWFPSTRSREYRQVNLKWWMVLAGKRPITASCSSGGRL